MKISNIINQTEKIDYLIVGQGLAGTLLSWFLLSEKKTFKIIDTSNPFSASQVAAGIMNPITGRRFVKSWKVETFFPFAEKTYQDLESFLNVSFFHKKNIVRSIFSQKDENAWFLRTGEPSYQKYFNETIDLKEFEGKIEASDAYCEIANSAQMNVPFLVNSFKKYLNKEGKYIKELFDYQEVRHQVQGLTYKNIEASKIIFCEGIQSEKNPWFKYLPFNGAKGEVLIVRIPNANFERMVKHKLFIVPLEDDLYWVGSFYEWNFEDEKPTQKGKEYLEDKLRLILKIPFDVVEHRSAVRPTVKDRRPFLGIHPDFPNLAIFNGLGTKGASLGPFFAKHMVNYLVNGTTLDKEVNINRFK
ncbi:FAD-binding oxidoreductase [Saprospiraceae bacterium]|jgi:glycine/D-amino acid oxidase-like deaminating enzyme|nr:FAD-binding oxidoreductase [Bacteroidota bacterium]MDB4727929.1 FAD-binding oxidoreductase [Saprospiraceae bacterium]MDF1864716.1 FAD-dependent oxidoreductase [Saprospiraceae bacterium]